MEDAYEPQIWSKQDQTDKGFYCSQCDIVQPFIVVKTYPGTEKRVRRRQCVCCGHRITTDEIAR